MATDAALSIHHSQYIMRLHIDGIIFSLQQHGGITVYFRELLSRFKAEHQATLTLEKPLRQAITSADLPAVRCIDRPSRSFERLRPCRLVSDSPTGVYHSTYYRRPELPGQPSVVTVHDFVYQRLLRGARSRMRRWLMNSAILQAQHIICISEATRQDLLEFVAIRADQQVSVIHNGVSDIFRLLPPAEPPLESRPFMLFVGQRGGYKNFLLALRALEHLPDVELHCVGGGALQAEELAGLPEATRGRVRHLGFVDDEQLNALYNRAHCLLYPSAYEGFGIPVLEAMRAGCPVVSVDCKAVMEVGGEALCVSEDPQDPVALARAVMRTSETGMRARLRGLGLQRSQQFSWDRCFNQTLAVYHSLDA